MTNRLKYYRVQNAKTQTEAARAAGVTQPAYQRCETGKVAIPQSNLAKLAKHFKTTEAELLGTHPPIEAAFYDDNAPEHLQYYGEIAVHFKSGTEPWALSISEASRSNADLHSHNNPQLFMFKDKGNASAAIRREPVYSLYVSFR